MKGLFLPEAELMGRALAGVTHQPVVLPFLGAAPKTRAGHLVFIVWLSLIPLASKLLFRRRKMHLTGCDPAHC
jgi:hypothetical protein